MTGADLVIVGSVDKVSFDRALDGTAISPATKAIVITDLMTPSTLSFSTNLGNQNVPDVQINLRSPTETLKYARANSKGLVSGGR